MSQNKVTTIFSDLLELHYDMVDELIEPSRKLKQEEARAIIRNTPQLRRKGYITAREYDNVTPDDIIEA